MACRASYVLLLLAVSFFAARPALSQQVHLVVSAESGDRMAIKPVVHFVPAGAPPAGLIQINDEVRYQKIDGFGASFLEAGLMCINSLSPKKQKMVFRSLFDVKTGAGFSAMKTVIASTDFMSAGPFYSYDDVPGDVEMKHFTISRDLGPDGLITYIKRARRFGTFVLEAPMDYPPDWMLFDVNQRQDVQPQFYDALSLYYLRYLQQYASHGVFIDYLSLFNEPDIYTKINYNEIGDLLRDHVGPLLAREHIRTQIMPSEAPTRDDASRNYPILLNDPSVAKYLAILPYHGYDFKNHDKIAELHQKYPKFPLWMTEVCWAYEVNQSQPVPLPRSDFADGDTWGNIIFNDLEASTSAWIYWNMILNQDGGPWSVSPVHKNPDPNAQQPVVIINQKTGDVVYTGLYYYLAHFSKYVRPGAIRIQTIGAREGVRVMSFLSPAGGIVTEVMNSNKSATGVDLAFHGKLLHLDLPAASITTAMWTGQRE